MTGTPSINNFFGLTYGQLEELLESRGLNPRGARLLFNHFYKKLHLSFALPNLAAATSEYLETSFNFSLPQIKNVKEANKEGATTYKFLVAMSDELVVECVLIPFQGKYTVCLSSQVGCDMNCSFCYTGTQGLTRSLEVHEIVGQLMAIKHWLAAKSLTHKISNIVFMGQGEPLHNFLAVKNACEILLSQYGLSIGREKITISTAGYLPGLKQWKQQTLSVNLALSLHSAKPSVRSQLIPLNKAYPLEEVLDLIKTLPLEKKRFVTFEVLLIKGLNDSQEEAQKIAELVKDCHPLLNIIPFNPFPGTPYQRPDNDSLESFRKITESYGIPTMVRKTKGDDILAACGQLTS